MDQDARENALAREAVELAQTAVIRAMEDKQPEDLVKQKLVELHEARAQLDVVRARAAETRPLILPQTDKRS